LSQVSQYGLLAHIIASGVAPAVTLGKVSASAGGSLNHGPGHHCYPFFLSGGKGHAQT